MLNQTGIIIQRLTPYLGIVRKSGDQFGRAGVIHQMRAVVFNNFHTQFMRSFDYPAQTLVDFFPPRFKTQTEMRAAESYDMGYALIVHNFHFCINISLRVVENFFVIIPEPAETVGISDRFFSIRGHRYDPSTLHCQAS